MHSLKTGCVGQVFALAKPHDSVGKRTRNRIPKEERKTLVESFIKKHQSLNNGSFPSLNLTHKEVGGSFYTIREIVREIIQENRVLGTSGLILEGKGDDDHLQDQTLSSSLLMDPVPPLSLSPDGFRPPSEGENINGSQAASEERGSDVLKDFQVNGHQFSEEGVVLLAHKPVGSTDISGTEFAGSFGEENGRMQTICDSFVSKPQDKELEVDKEDIAFEETPLIESYGTKPVNSDDRVNDDEAAMTEAINMRENTLGTPAEAVVETFPIRSETSSTVELAKVCEGGNGTEAKVGSDSSTETSVDLGEIPLSISDVSEEQGTEVTSGQMANQTSVAMEKKVEEKTVNPASVDVESSDTEGKVVDDAVISSSIHESKEFSNGSLTTERTTPTSGTESGSFKKDIARTSVEKATVAKGKHDTSDSTSTQKGNIAPLNRIKPESWKGKSNVAGGHETNPLLAALKSFLTAFVKFWSE
ncbi:DNA binding protein [Hirschfeldia incana]|nr:DNA binding protein [Hirschfeldia incana]